jgi:hypothetical protein
VWTERKRRGNISALGAQRTALVGAGLTLAHRGSYKFALHIIVVREIVTVPSRSKRQLNEPGPNRSVQVRAG